jgi:hypothetical protein
VTAPRDTSKLDPLGMAGALLGGPGYIEAQEAQGARELLASDVLPIDTHGTDDDFVALGFTFGDPVDDLFRNVTLPEGWTRQAGAGDPRGSAIVDGRGIVRVSIFYKAAFYDRCASMYLVKVGRQLAVTFIYGTDPVDIDWSLLTPEELSDLTAAARQYLKDAEEYPGIYGENAPKAKALLALAEAHA